MSCKGGQEDSISKGTVEGVGRAGRGDPGRPRK